MKWTKQGPVDGTKTFLKNGVLKVINKVMLLECCIGSSITEKQSAYSRYHEITNVQMDNGEPN